MDNTENTKQIFDNCANQYQDKFMNIELYQDTIDAFYNNIKAKKASVLELGRGPGNITKYLLSNRPGFNILGIDLAPKMITLAKKNNPTPTFKVMDARKITTLNTKYDGVLAGFYLPYLAKKEAILLDPVYSGKAFSGLIGLIKNKKFTKSDNVLFIHTGGAVSLFAYEWAFNKEF